ncbi:hypothetical protein niasHT_018380 [Heterodera trifolii]|uniref:RING-type domain-containing protein n=1 Tax=Heterodera trifolii TaxID=157864 RepID=A0ABD2LDD3_9BILA
MCKSNNDDIIRVIGQATPERTNIGIYSCIWLSINFTNCDQNDPGATIKISDANTNEWHEFVYPKWQLSALSEAIVLGFGIIESLVHKTFTLLNVDEGDAQNGRLINYEISLRCKITPSQRSSDYVFGSEFYQHSTGGNGNFTVIVKLYDIEMARSCYGDGRGNQNSIGIFIIKNTRLFRTFLYEKSTFIETRAFELDMRGDAEVVNFLPSSNVYVERGQSSNSSRQSTNFEHGSSSNRRRPSTSTAGDKNWEIVDEKVDGNPDEEMKNSITCTICMVNKRKFIFSPCMHACVCKSCAKNIMNSRAAGAKKCPICREKIEMVLPFFLS